MTERKKTVLIVDDDETNLLVASNMVKFAGCHPVSTRTPEEALDAFEREKPSLVLIDLGLPRMDGYKLAIELRQLERDSGCSTPLIAVSAYPQRLHEKKCINLGFALFVPKPLDLDAFVPMIRRFTTKDTHRESEV